MGSQELIAAEPTYVQIEVTLKEEVSNTTNPIPVPLHLCGSELEVKTFKYLGVSLTTSPELCSKARKILGLLYRQFYTNANPTALKQLSSPTLRICSHRH